MKPAATPSITAIGTPTPMPAFAPVESPPEGCESFVADGVEVVDAVVVVEGGLTVGDTIVDVGWTVEDIDVEVVTGSVRLKSWLLEIGSVPPEM